MVAKKIKKAIKKILEPQGIQVLKSNPQFFETVYQDLYAQESLLNRRFYNISAGGHFGFGGDFPHPYWTNVDVDINWSHGTNYDPSKDISHDLMEEGALPIESNSAEIVHSRLSIEHIPDSAAEKLFSESYRILKPGGVFRVACPDIDLDIRAVLANDKYFYDWYPTAYLKKERIERLFLQHFIPGVSESKIDKKGRGEISFNKLRELLATTETEGVLNFLTSLVEISHQKKNRYQHMNWWNYDKARKKLLEAGFKSVYRSQPWQSSSVVMRDSIYFDNYSNKFLMFVECNKN